MNSGDFIAMTRISNLANETLAEKGERCDRVPLQDLQELAPDGFVRYEPRATAAPAAEARATPKRRAATPEPATSGDQEEG